MFSGNKQIEMGRYSFVTALERGDDQNWHKDVDEPYRDFVGAAAFEDNTPAGAGEAVDPLHAAFPLPPPAPGSLVFLAIHDIPVQIRAPQTGWSRVFVTPLSIC